MKHTLLLAAASAVLLSSCGTSDGTSADSETIARDEFDTSEMLVNLTDNVIIPQFEAVAIQAEQTLADIESYCGEIGSDIEAGTLATAQDSWRDLIGTWQQTEAYLLGPTANNGSTLRNRIYSYNAQNTSACGIDQAVVLNGFNNFSIANRTNSSKGIDALEYLLFNENLEHNCPAIISETANWNDLAESTRKIQRCNYAQTIATDVRDATASIVTEWSVDGDNYRSVFLNPSNASTSVSAISDALFFIDTDVKDARLGGPLGRIGCTPVDCTGRESVESPYSANSYANIKANLEGFEAILFGAGGSSFDDLISSVDADELNTSFADNISGAIALIDASTTHYADDVAAIDSDQAIAECEMAIADPTQSSSYPACQIYGYVKALSDSLKTEFILATALEIPDRAQSDND